jgi:hypothetical protein
MFMFRYPSTTAQPARRAIDWRWEDAVRICQAAAATPISATTWSHTENIRVYFQNRDNAFQELKGSFDGGWYVRSPTDFKHLINKGANW